MKKLLELLRIAALTCAALGILCAPVLGQRGGSGGGGSTARHGGNYNVIWDPSEPINGRIPKSVGSVGVSTYVAVLNVSVRLSSVNLPDNTELTVTVYSKDYFTGKPWPSKVAGTITLLANSGVLPSTTFWITTPGFLPVVTSVVVTEADGTIVASGHP